MRRIWVFRMLALFLVPVCMLGAVELILRITDYGYPTSYFIPSRIDGEDFLIPNYKFSYRFFPPTLARVPALTRMPAEKPQDTFRIFVFGESAALGDPDPSYGISRYLQVLLEERYPDTDFEVVCLAMTAINSHAVLPIAREAAKLDGDLWIIYMGNNEMVGPFGAGTIFGAKAPRPGWVRTTLAVKATRIGQLIDRLTAGLTSGSRTPDQWTGIDMFQKNRLPYDDPKRLRAYRNFEGNLNDILEAGQKAGVPIILSTVASNLKDCSPFASLHKENLDTSERTAWEQYTREGLALEQEGLYAEALDRYSEAAAIDAEYAELHYRIGTCELALDRTDAALQAFILARDYDALAVRADTRINRILMNTNPGNDSPVVRINAAAALSDQSTAGINGRDYFYEHVHFTVDGNYALARLLAEQVQDLLPPEIRESQNGSWPDQTACNRRLALTVWDQLRLWHEESERIDAEPFTAQSGHAADRKYIQNQIKQVMSRVNNDTLAQDRQLYETALERTPDDPTLIGNYAQFLDGNGMTAQAIPQAERFCALLPDLAWTHYYLAALNAKAGRFHEARAGLEKALEIRGDFTQARVLLERLN